jgi:general stress protein 26
MDSINRNQEEENRKDLAGKESISKLKELVEKANICFFCTTLKYNQSFSTRPMSVQKVDEHGILWFLSAVDSHKNSDINKDPKVQLLFQGSQYSDFLNLYGTATINQDKAKISELWDPILKTWFTEGKDDPRISVIKFTPEEGYYWDTKHGAMVAIVKRLAGAIAGKTIDDSIEGTLAL